MEVIERVIYGNLNFYGEWVIYGNLNFYGERVIYGNLNFYGGDRAGNLW